MNWIIFLFALELGWLPQGDFVMYESNMLDAIYPVREYFYTDLEAEVELGGCFFMGGGIKTMMFSSGDISFFPYSSNYKMFAGARLGMLEIGFRHYCIHPVLPWFGLGWDAKMSWEGWYEELYIRISNRGN